MSTSLNGVFVLTGTAAKLTGQPTITLPFELTPAPAVHHALTIAAAKPVANGMATVTTAVSTTATTPVAIHASVMAEITAPAARRGPSRSQQIIALMRARAARRIATRAQPDEPQ